MPTVRAGTGGGPGRRRARAWRFTSLSGLTLAAALVLLVCLAGTAVGRSHHTAADRAPVTSLVAASVVVDSGQPAAVAPAAAVPLHPITTGHGLVAIVGASATLGVLLALPATTRPWRARVRAVRIAPRADRGPPTAPPR